MNARHDRILALLSRAGEVSVRDLVAEFGVTPMTIRRDLAALERDGRVVRTHGGALMSRPGRIEFQFAERGAVREGQKRAIALAARGLVKPGMTLSIDTGTTPLAFARAVADLPGITVLTSSLAVAAALYPADGIDLVLLGGMARKDGPDLYGELTEANLEQFRVDVAVIGADAASREGLFTTAVPVARVSKAMVAGARRVMLLVDSSKFGGTAFRKFADWDDVDVAITDDGLGRSTRRWLADAVETLEIVRVEE